MSETIDPTPVWPDRRALLREIAALRKRVKEAESKLADAYSRLSLLQADSSGHMHTCALVNGKWACAPGCAVARAEKAERELAQGRAVVQRADTLLLEIRKLVGGEDSTATTPAVVAMYITSLQADLDAALVLCIDSDWDIKILGEGYEPEIYEAHARIKALLEKRREGRG